MARSIVASAGERIPGVRVASKVLPVARTVLLPYLVTRAVILFVALWLQWLLDTHRTYYYAFIGHAPLAPLSALFDANWYVSLAREGYSLSANTAQAQNYAFFPLYPASISFVSSLLGGADSSWVYFTTGLVLSHVFFFAALCLLYVLTSRVWGSESFALRVVWVACVWPWSFVFSMTYTESLFLLLSLGSLLMGFYAFQRPDFRGAAAYMLAAGGLAALAALTRAQGVLLILPLALAALTLPLRIPGDKSRGAIPRIALAGLAAIPAMAVLGLFMLYIGVRTGDLQAVMKVQNAWGHGLFADLPRVFVLPPENPAWLVDFISTLSLLVWVLVSAALLIGAIRIWRSSRSGAAVATSESLLFGNSAEARTWRMHPVAGWPLLLTVYALSCLCITVYSAPANMGWGRYMLIAFPCFWVVAAWSSKSQSPRLPASLGVMLQVLLLSAAVIAQVTP